MVENNSGVRALERLTDDLHLTHPNIREYEMTSIPGFSPIIKSIVLRNMRHRTFFVITETIKERNIPYVIKKARNTSGGVIRNAVQIVVAPGHHLNWDDRDLHYDDDILYRWKPT